MICSLNIKIDKYHPYLGENGQFLIRSTRLCQRVSPASLRHRPWLKWVRPVGEKYDFTLVLQINITNHVSDFYLNKLLYQIVLAD